MEALYSGAQWRPLGNVSDEPGIVPRLLIVHTMVGYLFGTERYFKEGNGKGYQGTESTFGLGGPWDGATYDGVLFQWQRLDREADAQYDGNPIATSIECSDGGNPRNPFSPKQVSSLIQIGVWWALTTGRPPKLAVAWNGFGLGWHSLFEEWNRAHHACPGAVRIKQLKQTIFPEIAKRVSVHHPAPAPAKPKPGFPAFPLPSGHWFGVPSSDPRNHSGYWPADRPKVSQWQTQMRHRGWKISVTGRFDKESATTAASFAKEKRYRPVQGYGTVDAGLWKLAWTAAVT